MSVIFYLFCGVVWNVILEVIGYVLKSEHTLTNWEKVFSILAWPITLSIFTYHFVKTFFTQ